MIQQLDQKPTTVLYIFLSISPKTRMRHKRIQSDLQGLKQISSLKKKIQPQKDLRTIDRVNKSVSNSEGISSNKTIDSPETPKKQESVSIISDTRKLLEHYYMENQIGFYEKAWRYLKGGWESNRKNFNQHLNKIFYAEKSMYKKNYTQIESQIIREWRKNPVLYNLRSMWYESIVGCKFSSIGKFVEEYRLQCQFIGQLANIYFKGFFTVLSSKIKTNDTILDRLIFRTSHFILTESNTWCKIYSKVLEKMIKKKVDVEDNFIVKNFDLNSLGLSPYAFDIESKQLQLPKTSDKIAQFNFENRIGEKIKLLIQVREALQKQILEWQQVLIKKKKIKKIQLLDKDDFIGCLIYCVVKGEIPLDELGSSVKMFRYLLDDECSNILSKWGCDSYLSDLQSVFDYLVHWTPEYKTLQSLTVTL